MTSYKAASADTVSIHEVIARHAINARFIRLALSWCFLGRQLHAHYRRSMQTASCEMRLLSSWSLPSSSAGASKLTARNFGRDFLRYLRSADASRQPTHLLASALTTLRNKGEDHANVTSHEYTRPCDSRQHQLRCRAKHAGRHAAGETQSEPSEGAAGYARPQPRAVAIRCRLSGAGGIEAPRIAVRQANAR